MTSFCFEGCSKNTRPAHIKQAQLPFPILAALKVYPSLCFCTKFQPDFSSLSAGEKSRQTSLSESH